MAFLVWTGEVTGSPYPERPPGCVSVRVDAPLQTRRLSRSQALGASSQASPSSPLSRMFRGTHSAWAVPGLNKVQGGWSPYVSPGCGVRPAGVSPALPLPPAERPYVPPGWLRAPHPTSIPGVSPQTPSRPEHWGGLTPQDWNSPRLGAGCPTGSLREPQGQQERDIPAWGRGHLQVPGIPWGLPLRPIRGLSLVTPLVCGSCLSLGNLPQFPSASGLTHRPRWAGAEEPLRPPRGPQTFEMCITYII